MNFLQAIAREEGFYAPGSRPHRNNNPGDIEWHPEGIAAEHGAMHGDPRFAVFPTPEAGFAAMHALLQTSGYKGKTVEQALNRWAPPIENNVSAYLANVCQWANCKPDDVIDGLL